MRPQGKRDSVEEPLFYSEDEVLLLLKLPLEEVRLLAETSTLIACKLADGALIYPIFQFQDGDGFTPEAVMLAQLFSPASWSGWEIVHWLFTPQYSLPQEQAPIELYRSEGLSERLRLIALHARDLSLL